MKAIHALCAIILFAPTTGCTRDSVADTQHDPTSAHAAYSGPRVSVPTVPGDYKVASSGYGAYRRDGFRPRSDVRAVKLALPINWAMDPFSDGNWRFQLEAWRMLNPLWGEFRKHNDPSIAREILDIMRDWERFHLLENRRASYAWQDMATGLRAQHIAYVYHLVTAGEIKLGQGDQDVLNRLARTHAEKLREVGFFSLNNHGIFQMQGLRLLCNEAPAIEACRGEETYSARRMGELIKQQFDAYGVHSEDAPFYHVFAYKTFNGIRWQLYPSLSPGIGRRIRLAKEVAPWFSMPNGQIAAVGDSEGKGVPFPANYRPLCMKSTDSGDCIMVGDLTKSGYAIVRTAPGVPLERSSMLFVSGSSHDAGHDHADELGFVLFSKGQPLLVDGGKYGYRDDRWRSYFISDRAHNVAGLAGKGFMPADTIGDGSSLTRISDASGEFRIEGEVRRTGGFENRRTFKYRPGRYLEIFDKIAAAPSARVEVRFHWAPGLQASITGNKVRITNSEEEGVADLQAVSGNCNFSIANGREKPDFQGWYSPSYLEVVPINTILLTCAPGETRVASRITIL